MTFFVFAYCRNVLPVVSEMISVHVLAELAGKAYFLNNQLRDAMRIFASYSDPNNVQLASVCTILYSFDTFRDVYPLVL